ncbi:hypothetical protein ACHAXR_008120 [Thalassiosira sp. AJA248-18]
MAKSRRKSNDTASTTRSSSDLSRHDTPPRGISIVRDSSCSHQAAVVDNRNDPIDPPGHQDAGNSSLGGRRRSNSNSVVGNNLQFIVERSNLRSRSVQHPMINRRRQRSTSFTNVPSSSSPPAKLKTDTNIKEHSSIVPGVRQMEFTDVNGNHGHYSGEVNQGFVPHGNGVMRYDAGIKVEGAWENGKWRSRRSQHAAAAAGKWQGEVVKRSKSSSSTTPRQRHSRRSKSELRPWIVCSNEESSAKSSRGTTRSKSRNIKERMAIK